VSTRFARTLLGPATVSWAVAACAGTIEVAPDAGSHPDAASQSSDAAASDVAASDGAAIDGAVCVDIDVSTYDRSCHADADCINVSAGMICSGYNCLCGGAAISADAEPRYKAAFASVQPGPGPYCECPYFGRPRCIQAECVYCPSSVGPMPAPPGCPDGG
jgi:hypothetical protein